MVENRGNTITGATPQGHRPIPLATDGAYGQTHTPLAPKRAGFDWDWNKAPCTGCGTKTAKPQLVDGRCPTCRGDESQNHIPADVTSINTDDHGSTYAKLSDQEVKERFTASTRPDPAAAPAPAETGLGRALADLEAADPVVAAASSRLDDVVRRVTQPADHLTAPARLPDLIAAVTEIRATYDQAMVSVRALGDALGALQDLCHDLNQTPAAPPSPRAAASRATSRPAADPEGEAGQRPARVNGSTALRARLDAHGITTAEVKKWALTNGLIPSIAVGPVSARLIDAYLNAHDNTSTTSTGATT